MNSHSIDFRQITLDKIRYFLDRSHDRAIDLDHAYAIMYTAALASNPVMASDIASDLQIPMTSSIKRIAAKAIRFATIEERPSDGCALYTVEEYQDDDITYFLMCALAASFVKNFNSYDVLRKLLIEFYTRETIVADAVRLTCYVQTLTQLALENATPESLRAASTATLPTSPLQSALIWNQQIAVGKAQGSDVALTLRESAA